MKAMRFNAKTAFYTLLMKEVHRFMKVAVHTVAAPVISALMYLLVFGAALNGKMLTGSSIDYVGFLAPGLVMMAVLNNAFANSSSSFIQSKISGSLDFILMPPMGSLSVAGAYVLASAVRGLFVGACVWVGTLVWADFHCHNPAVVLGFSLGACILMGSLGLIAAVLADRYEQMGLIQNFVVMPMTFLSGVFYSIESLPEIWQTVTRVNPIYYLIDGFRGGFIGLYETDPMLSLFAVTVCATLSFTASVMLLKSGYRLRK